MTRLFGPLTQAHDLGGSCIQIHFASVNMREAFLQPRSDCPAHALDPHHDQQLVAGRATPAGMAVDQRHRPVAALVAFGAQHRTTVKRLRQPGRGQSLSDAGLAHADRLAGTPGIHDLTRRGRCNDRTAFSGRLARPVHLVVWAGAFQWHRGNLSVGAGAAQRFARAARPAGAHGVRANPPQTNARLRARHECGAGVPCVAAARVVRGLASLNRQLAHQLFYPVCESIL